MTKYAKLVNWLNAQARETVSLTFGEIDRILGWPLPPSARRYQAFWSAGNHVGRILKASGWRARPAFLQRVIHFSRCKPASRPALSLGRPKLKSASRPESAIVDIVLVGCVKSKRPGRHPACDLYTSTLFQRRRAYAERSGAPWFVLSAKYGLLAPDTVVDSYDLDLAELPSFKRRIWAKRVVLALEEAVGPLAGKRIEIHSGGRYRRSGLVEDLRMRGATVDVPLAHLRLGEQIAWYDGCSNTLRAASGHAPIAAHSDPEVGFLVEHLTRNFSEGRFNLSDRPKAPPPGWPSMPELRAVRRLEEMGADAVRQRIFLTLIAALDRARDADSLWEAGATLYQTAPWAFEPKEVQRRSLVELRQRLVASGVAQRPVVDSTTWRLIAEALDHPDAPRTIRQAVLLGEGDALELVEDLHARDRVGQPWFPYLSGPKVSLMWIRMLAVPGNATIRNIEAIPVAVDVHVRRVTENLGLAHTRDQQINNAIRTMIQDAWSRGATSAVGPDPLLGTCAALDPAIWFFGKWGCGHCEKIGRRAPIGEACENCRLPR